MGEEVSLQQGLYLVQNENKILKSDGLSDDEYMHYIPGLGICYEDDCVIGSDYHVAFIVLNSMEWTHNHKFYICEKPIQNNGGRKNVFTKTSLYISNMVYR